MALPFILRKQSQLSLSLSLSLSHLSVTHTLAHPLPHFTRTAEVNNADGTPLGITEQNVLRFEVTVNDIEGGVGEKEQSCAQLLRKFACEVEGHAPEVGVPEQLIKVIGEELKDQTEVITEHEVTFQPH